MDLGNQPKIALLTKYQQSDAGMGDRKRTEDQQKFRRIFFIQKLSFKILNKSRD